jgi:hypothetical protein
VEEPNAPDTLAALQSLRLLGVEPPEPERTEDGDGDYATLTIGWAALLGLDALGAEPSQSLVVWLWRRVGVLLRRPAARDWSGAVNDLAYAGELHRLIRAELDPPRVRPSPECSRRPANRKESETTSGPFGAGYKKLQRLCRDEDLRVPVRRRRKPIGVSTQPPAKGARIGCGPSISGTTPPTTADPSEGGELFFGNDDQAVNRRRRRAELATATSAALRAYEAAEQRQAVENKTTT